MSFDINELGFILASDENSKKRSGPKPASFFSEHSDRAVKKSIIEQILKSIGWRDARFSEDLERVLGLVFLDKKKEYRKNNDPQARSNIRESSMTSPIPKIARPQRGSWHRKDSRADTAVCSPPCFFGRRRRLAPSPIRIGAMPVMSVT